MNCKSIILAVLCLLGSSKMTNAQTSGEQFISISAFSEALGIPKHTVLHYLNDPFELNHFGGAVSIGFSSGRSLISFAHEIELGYYRQQGLHQVAFIGWKPSVGVKLFDSFGAHAMIGLSYAHSLPVNKVYLLQGDEYINQQGRGRSHFMPSLGAGLSVDFFGLLDVPIELFLRQEIFGLAPYAPDGDFPFTINHKISLGLKVAID